MWNSRNYAHAITFDINIQIDFLRDIGLHVLSLGIVNLLHTKVILCYCLECKNTKNSEKIQLFE